jgi:predicted ArsR family transcriptional regulator
MLSSGASPGDRVLEVLKQSGGGLSVKELCQKLDLSSMAVRRQITLLESGDLVLSQKEKQKVGRPTNFYFLTEKGHERFHRDYADLAVDLLVSLRSLDGKEKLNDVFEQRRQRYLETCRPKIPGKTLESRVHEVAQLLSRDGYMATWERVGPKSYLIKEMNCPVSRVARKFPQLCIHEEALLAELLQARVSRQHHLLRNEQYCSYLVEG